MVNVGANGPTKQQILTATGLTKIGKTDQEIDGIFKSLFSTLEIKTTGGKEKAREQWERLEPSLNLANRVYVQESLQVKPQFSDRLNNSYNSTFGKLNPGTAKNDINHWVESVTNGKIKDLFGEIADNVRMVLVSAIYFKAEWEDTFSESSTQQKDFYASGTNKVKVPMMTTFDDEAGYATFPQLDATALLKSYVGNTVRLVVILPNKKDGLPQLEQKITKDVFLPQLEQKITKDVFSTKNYQTNGAVEVTISLPKFKIEDSFQLNEGLQKVGIRDAFSDGADFSGISSVRLKIDEVVHKSFIDVNEKGTEAAAATGIKMVPLSMTIRPESAKKVFNADHPFIFAIQHVATEAVLFIGRYTGPSSH